MMPKPQKYPNSLRKYRKAAGLRQHEVAQALKLNTCERISKWENGHSVPALWSLFQLAMLYHVSPQELYDEMYRSIVNPSASVTPSELGIPEEEDLLHPSSSSPLYRGGEGKVAADRRLRAG